MAEKDIIEAVKVGKSLAKIPAKNKGSKKRNVYYFPIGRSIATIAGVLKIINASDVQKAFANLANGDLGGFTSRIQSAMSTSLKQKAEGVGMISTGIVLGKALDATHTNPRLKMGGYGAKLV